MLAGFAIGGFLYTALVRSMLAALGLCSLIRWGAYVCGLGFAGLALGGSWPVEALAFVVVGLGFYMIHNSLQTQATELAPGARAAAVAAHAFFFFLGQAAGPHRLSASLLPNVRAWRRRCWGLGVIMARARASATARGPGIAVDERQTAPTANVTWRIAILIGALNTKNAPAQMSAKPMA